MRIIDYCKPSNALCRSKPDLNRIIDIALMLPPQMNLVEVVYEAGFCLPRLIVKEEAQEVMKKV